MNKKFNTAFRHLTPGDKVSFEHIVYGAERNVQVEGIFRKIVLSEEPDQNFMILVGDSVDTEIDNCVPYLIPKVENLKVEGIPYKFDIETGTKVRFDFIDNEYPERLIVEGLFDRVITDKFDDDELYIAVYQGSEVVHFPVWRLRNFAKL